MMRYWDFLQLRSLERKVFHPWLCECCRTERGVKCNWIREQQRLFCQRQWRYDQYFIRWPLRNNKIKLNAYNGVVISVYGEVYLPVNYDQQEMILPLIVVDGDGLKLLGRNFLEATEVELEQYLPCEQD